MVTAARIGHGQGGVGRVVEATSDQKRASTLILKFLMIIPEHCPWLMSLSVAHRVRALPVSESIKSLLQKVMVLYWVDSI